LVRHYTRQTIGDIKGPITVVSGKQKRLTFLECPNDVSSMMDVAKVADLVLLMIDAHYGFEMVSRALPTRCCPKALQIDSGIACWRVACWSGNIRVFERSSSARFPQGHGCIESFGFVQVDQEC
jgi:hypothetical protein